MSSALDAYSASQGSFEETLDTCLVVFGWAEALGVLQSLVRLSSSRALRTALKILSVIPGELRRQEDRPEPWENVFRERKGEQQSGVGGRGSGGGRWQKTPVETRKQKRKQWMPETVMVSRGQGQWDRSG